MFQNIRQDFRIHGRLLRNRAFWALVLYRFGRWSARLRPPPLRWVAGKLYGACTIFAPVITGVAIDRRMEIGEGFHIVHPGMILIHPDVRIGKRLGLMHNVTIGLGADGRVPRIGDDVFIGTGAVLLGGITIGDKARIAANTLVICDVPAGALAIGVPAKVYVSGSPMNPVGRAPAAPVGAQG